ncbi:hypothetical protein BKG80_03710 [Mycobacteroides chelonae]|uniref:hypothetical protein n=1 Tax=Mycobacteroides chelonae TaxID=1774 RepID=UPI0008A91087|nr:hypothetical protein [Mycobacteroides chelonae]MBF9349944.1 hypothetical protein [Mycobacteroides chelonae]OHU42057.1 hypothetical protein BKG80_03710 [Mycobacteroides chelonae]
MGADTRKINQLRKLDRLWRQRIPLVHRAIEEGPEAVLAREQITMLDGMIADIKTDLGISGDA